MIRSRVLSLISAAVAATCLLAFDAFFATAPASAVTTKKSVQCTTISPHGLIGERWRSNPDGFGCALNKEYGVPGRRGLRQDFERGQIAWSPDQGHNMVVSVYRQGNQANIHWGPTAPFRYSYFIVRWDRDGRFPGQRDVGSGTSGTHIEPLRAHGVFNFIVEGCDERAFSNSVCRQRWTIPVSVRYTGEAPGPSPELVKPSISVSYNRAGPTFTVTGYGFRPNRPVHVRVVNRTNLSTVFFQTTSDQWGRINNYPISFAINTPQTYSFSANDERRNSNDLTGTLWSNTATITAT